MKKTLALFAALAALTGCQTTQKIEELQPVVTTPLTMLPPAYTTLGPAARQKLVAASLRTIGAAIKAYTAKHGGTWPTSLSVLVAERLLPAQALISASDPTGGQEGGVPDSYDAWQPSSETDEANCSFLYEFSGAAAAWDWKSYLAGKPSVAALDTDKNGEVSWQEAKLWQLAHGDTSQAAPAAYAKHRFPIVRCYWYGFPGSKDDTTMRSVISLAADLETVFLSQPWWERDASPVILP